MFPLIISISVSLAIAVLVIFFIQKFSNSDKSLLENNDIYKNRKSVLDKMKKQQELNASVFAQKMKEKQREHSGELSINNEMAHKKGNLSIKDD